MNRFIKSKKSISVNQFLSLLFKIKNFDLNVIIQREIIMLIFNAQLIITR